MKNSDSIAIIEFSDDLKQHIKILNYSWLKKYFKVEHGDKISLSNPKLHIIGKGGCIFYAKKRMKLLELRLYLK